MDLVKWDPWRDFGSLRHRMNRLFDDFDWGFPVGRESLGSVWAPPLDLSETADDFRVKVELPGIDEKDIQVTVQDNTLTIKGSREQKSEVKEENFHRVERQYGSFQRSVLLPASVDASKVEAGYRQGVLEITLPKAEAVKPKAIEIKTTS